MKESSFAKYLQAKIQSVPPEEKAKFAECLACGCGEEGLTKSFAKHILDHLDGKELRVIPWPEKRQPRSGFFGEGCKPDDLQVEHAGKKVLLECKLLKDAKNYDVRNAFSQLVEYLLPMEWDEGCVVLFDIRKKCHDNVFSGSNVAERNCWFVNRFSMDGCPLEEGTERKDILISAIRVHATGETPGVEICPPYGQNGEGNSAVALPPPPGTESSGN